MKNGLTSLPITIDDKPVSSFGKALFLGKSVSNENHLTDQRGVFLGDLRDSFNVFSGDDDGVRGRLGMDVFEGED